MTIRSGAGLIVAVAALLMAVLPGAGGAMAADPTAAELCELFPQDSGFNLQANQGNRSCYADLGDCDGMGSDRCYSGTIKLMDSAKEADDYARRSGDLDVMTGLGDAAAGGCLEWGCTVQFARERYLVLWIVPPDRGLAAARSLAALVDQAVERHLATAAGGGLPSATAPPAATTPAPAASGLSSAYVDAFFGTGGLKEMGRDIRRAVDCRNMDGTEIPAIIEYGGQDLFVCQGFLAAASLRDIVAQFKEDYPEPTQRQLEGIRVYGTAVGLAGMVGTDGNWLFPSIGKAMPLIKRMSDAKVVRRFVEMLAAMDMANWPQR